VPPSPQTSRSIQLHWMDVDVGGDVHRILLSDLPVPHGLSVRERMEWLAGPGDGLRQLLIEPPLGDPAFCVDWITPALEPDAQAAFVIMECMGYPFFSGSNTMATACGLLASGYLPKDIVDGHQILRLEAPGGRVDAHVSFADGMVQTVAIEGDEAFVQLPDQQVEVVGIGVVPYTLCWSGGHYVMVDAESLGVSPQRAGEPEGLAMAAAIIEAIQQDFTLQHPRLGDVGLPRFLHWMWPALESESGCWQGIGGTYGHPGVLWRCPTGTGTAARLAMLSQQERSAVGARIQNTSPAGTMFEATLRGHGRVGDYPSIHTRVVGSPQVLGEVRLELPITSPALAGRDLDWLFA